MTATAYHKAVYIAVCLGLLNELLLYSAYDLRVCDVQVV